MDNKTIAQHLLDHATRLEATKKNLYRVRAFRRAASLIKMMPRELSELYAEGGKAELEMLPGIGKHIAFTLVELLEAGQFRTLGDEVAPYDPERALTSLPGVGAQTAYQLREQLGIHTLDEVEEAAQDGRLEQIGMGPKRIRNVLESLEGRRRRA